MKTGLFFAIHWAVWNIWTLNTSEVFRLDRDKFVLSLEDAVRANHMATIGDVSVGTKFSLAMVMVANKGRSRTVDANGSVTFTIERIEHYCNGLLIEDEIEKRIATYLMFFGKWTHEELPTLAEDQIESLERRWSPTEDHAQGFEIVDSLSGMFSTFYKFATQDEKAIDSLQMGASAQWGHLIPEDYQGKVLPLWLFKLEPAPLDRESKNSGESEVPLT
jgi:hypothetical protein